MSSQRCLPTPFNAPQDSSGSFLHLFISSAYCIHTAPTTCIKQHATALDQHKIIILHVWERNDCKWSILGQINWLSNKTDQNSLLQDIFLEFCIFSPTDHYTDMRVPVQRHQLSHCPSILKKKKPQSTRKSFCHLRKSGKWTLTPNLNAENTGLCSALWSGCCFGLFSKLHIAQASTGIKSAKHSPHQVSAYCCYSDCKMVTDIRCTQTYTRFFPWEREHLSEGGKSWLLDYCALWNELYVSFTDISFKNTSILSLKQVKTSPELCSWLLWLLRWDISAIPSTPNI